ncbi:hypothetical protein EVAR_724_1 [Eumeta japonica]|uniref:Uncharacterized protein n=1 Tax=Eumeta variegata TaxID=151549 RepID=A0A4C1SCK0_EUMVA|nr:hypothetical protein EVAR_724_1 [Eumeta japonica]
MRVKLMQPRSDSYVGMCEECLKVRYSNCDVRVPMESPPLICGSDNPNRAYVGALTPSIWKFSKTAVLQLKLEVAAETPKPFTSGFAKGF